MLSALGLNKNPPSLSLQWPHQLLNAHAKNLNASNYTVNASQMEEFVALSVGALGVVTHMKV